MWNCFRRRVRHGEPEQGQVFSLQARYIRCRDGADEEYSGRMVIDQATLDRFAIIDFDYDRNIENQLTKGNDQLIDFVRELRKEAKEKGIRATFSYRCLTMVTKLEKVLDLEDVIKIAVMKGLDLDTIKTFVPETQIGGMNKYVRALKRIKNEM